MATTALQLAANRANALLSTGPRTGNGKTRSSRNHHSHGLTTRAALLPGEDPDEYHLHHHAYADHHLPKGPVSQQLVTELADLKWRLHRVPTFEAQLLNAEFTKLKSEPEFQPLIAAFPDDVQILALAFSRLVTSKVLPNLFNQEARLARRVEKLERQLEIRCTEPPPIAPPPSFNEELEQPESEPPEPSQPLETKKREEEENERIEIPQNCNFEPNRQPIRLASKIGRNEPCPCQSGLKYKRCCLQPRPLSSPYAS